MRRVVVVLSLLVASLVVITPAAAHAAAAPTTGFRWTDITAADGVVLKSNVIEPTTPGPHPGIVFVASWALNDLQYLAQERQFAEAGYTVLSYTTRGFWFSGGTIDVAGPHDIADASTAVDWLIAHTHVDQRRIGIVGMSYGGGISLLAAAHDPRLRAVASLSGWADLAASMDGGNTRRAQAAWFLQTTARLLGRPSPEMTQVLDDYWADRNAEGRERWAQRRSALYEVDAINRNDPAVLVAHSFGDSVFPANQMVDFYSALRTPKRLELAPGDHATAELPGLAGLPNHVWTSVRRWFDRYLRGIDTGIAGEPGVVLRPHKSSAVEYYPDWAHVAGHATRENQGPRQIRSGTDTVADAGVALLSNGLEGLTGIPPIVWLPAVSRKDAAVWTSAPAPAGGWPVRGVPRLHAPMSSSHPGATVVAYLYDVNSLGFGKLFSHAPVTWPGSTTTVDLPLQVTAYDVPAGHRLALVLDTKDPLYLDANSGSGTIAVGGGAWLDVPLR